MSLTSGVLPLNERKMDWFFIVIFGVFIFTSLAADFVNAVFQPDPDSGYFWARAVFELYARNNDPLLVANPEWLRVMTLLSSFIFGPFYIVLIISFAKGWNGIRPWALFYAGMIVESVIIIIFVEFRGEAALFAQIARELKPADELSAVGLTADLKVLNPLKFLLFNLPYIIVPLLLALRMRKPAPFAAVRPRERDIDQ